MKKILLAFLAWGIALSAVAQTDSTRTETPEKADTIRVGGMIIVRQKGKDKDGKDIVSISNARRKKNPNISTNWFIVDLGFANINDNTDYSSAAAQAMAPGFGEEQFKLQTVKSVNVNIWLFMQKLNLVKHVVNLKYGLGLELNNYRFDDKRVRFHKNPTLLTLEDSWADDLKKNKLAADYITIPMMLNFNFTPNKRKGFGLSAGVSAGMLYAARQKIKEHDGNKTKTKDDFGLRKFKISYIGELTLGPVRLYGSYATRSMWEKGFDHTPYTLGIRLSNW